MSLLDDAKMFWRFATGLRRFLRTPLTPGDCRRIVEESLRNREQTFLRLLKRVVFGYPKSPYLALLKWAGVECGDVERIVNQDGIEAAMERLYHAGVHLHLDEFKGRRPIQRPGLSLKVRPEDFDNPLSAREFEVSSGGSTGRRRRIAVDLDLLAYEAACNYLFHEAHGVETRPSAIWLSVPPGSGGLKNALRFEKFGHPLERWFTPYAQSWEPAGLKFTVFTAYAVYGSRFWGGSVPVPEYVPLSEPEPIARWLADKVRQGRPAFVLLPANSAVRVCMAAKEEGLEIGGTLFRTGGESLTSAKDRLVREVGANTTGSWSMSEAGVLGAGCANREVIDELHLYTGKLAVFQHPKLLSDGVSSVNALHLTTLLTSTPKIMLNVDTGDYGVLTKRRCGCLLEKVGWEVHLHTIRNYEKLTTGGMHFMGTEFVSLVEEILPSVHGGHPSDYQFVEEEQDAISRVSIVVSPRVGEVDEEAVVGTVLKFLASSAAGGKLMAKEWEEGRTLRVVREEPYVTPAAKIPPLRIRRGEEDNSIKTGVGPGT